MKRAKRRSETGHAFQIEHEHEHEHEAPDKEGLAA